MSTALAIDPVRTFGPAEPIRTFGAAAPAPAPVGAVASTHAPAAAARPAALARPRVLAASVLLTGAVAVAVAQLLLSIGTADGAYQVHALEQRSQSLARQQQTAEESLRALAAPERLAARATALGMVPDDAPAYLDARTGAVSGSVAPVSGAAATPGGLTR